MAEDSSSSSVLGGVGCAAAVVLSALTNHSFWWGFLHFFCGWFYVVYWFCVHGPLKAYF